MNPEEKYKVIYVKTFDMRKLPQMLAANHEDWKIAFIVPCIDESDENISSENTNWGKRKEKRIVTVGFEIILEKNN